MIIKIICMYQYRYEVTWDLIKTWDKHILYAYSATVIPIIPSFGTLFTIHSTFTLSCMHIILHNICSMYDIYFSFCGSKHLILACILLQYIFLSWLWFSQLGWLTPLIHEITLNDAQTMLNPWKVQRTLYFSEVCSSCALICALLTFCCNHLISHSYLFICLSCAASVHSCLT